MQFPLDERAPAAGEAPAGIHLTDYLQVLRRHWKIAALAVVLSTLVASIHYVITPKQFRAATTLQIERRSLSSLTGDQNPWLENYWNMEYYPTQYRLLQSRGLAERVVLDLRLMEDADFNPGATAGQSTPSADGDRAVLGALGARLLGGLSVTPVSQTQLVEVAYVSSNPQFAARVANGFAHAFIDWGIESRSETAGKASTFLGSQVETLKQEIQDKETQLQAYARRSDIVALDPGSNVLMQRLEALNQDYIGAVSERINKEARYNELTNTSPEALADTLAAGLVGELRSDQIKMERDYATKLQTYKPEWPAMVELKAQIDKGRQNLDGVIKETVSKARETARSEYQTALRREQSLAAELEQTKSDAMQLNSAAVEYNNLKLEVSTRRQLLDEMLRKQSETEVTSRLQGSRESNIHIVDGALVPGGAFRPSLRKDVTMGFALGLVVGIGAIFLLEYLDRTIKHPEEVEQLLGLPTLGVIPDTDESGAGYGYRSKGYGYGYGYGQGRGQTRARRVGGQKRNWLEKKSVSAEETPSSWCPTTAPAGRVGGLPLAAHGSVAVERARIEGRGGHLGGFRRGQDLHRHQSRGGHGATGPASLAARRRPAQTSAARDLPPAEPDRGGELPHRRRPGRADLPPHRRAEPLRRSLRSDAAEPVGTTGLLSHVRAADRRACELRLRRHRQSARPRGHRRDPDRLDRGRHGRLPPRPQGAAGRGPRLPGSVATLRGAAVGHGAQPLPRDPGTLRQALPPLRGLRRGRDERRQSRNRRVRMMVDLHCHLLPGIDDGAQHLEESVEMCRLAFRDGCTTLVATPHQRTESWDARDLALLTALREQVQERVGPALRLLPGAEVRIDSELLDELERLPASGLLPLASSRYLLLEFHRSPSPAGVDPLDLLHELSVAGWRPIFAHPEFIPWLAVDPDLAAVLVERGALFQLTAMSVTGDFGRRAQAVCETFLDRGLAHFVASDAHGPERRPPGLSRARQAIAARWGEDTARRLTGDNPLAVIENRPLAVEAPR